MTTEEWLAAVLADRPPLTPEQVSRLRPIFAPVIPHMKAAPVTAAEAAHPGTHAPDQTRGTINATR